MTDSRPTLRIVSLVPSATETVFDLGLGDALVARSHACDFPEAATRRPALTKPCLETTTSRAIHDEVRERLAQSLSLYDIDLDALRALAPSHLLLQDQCAVCAVSPADFEETLKDWIGKAPEVIRLEPHLLADVWRDIERIGGALGRAEEARTLTMSLSHELADIAESVRPTQHRPRVACIEWLDPIMISGHWVPELVRIAGGEPILSRTGGPSNTVSIDQLVEAAPDYIFIAPCGFDETEAGEALRNDSPLRAGLDQIEDSKGSAPHMVLCDGNRYFNRPGPRLIETAQLISKALRERPRN